MKICWDNLEGVWLSKRGNLRKGHHIYYEVTCLRCGEDALIRRGSKYCSPRCSELASETHGMGKDNKTYHKFRYKDPKFRKRKRGLSAQWKRDNPGRVNAAARNRKIKKLNLVPDNADHEVIDWYYIISRQMSERVGIQRFYHVAHIIPLSKGGLHHEDNLQILTAQQNLSKGAS